LGTRSWTLGAQEADLRIDAQNMVDQALTASREGSIFSRTVRGLFGGSVHRNIPVVVSYSHAAVRNLTAQVRSAVNRPSRNASVQAGASGLTKVRGRDGLRVESKRSAHAAPAARSSFPCAASNPPSPSLSSRPGTRPT
jgi:hypothetical protein